MFFLDNQNNFFGENNFGDKIPELKFWFSCNQARLDIFWLKCSTVDCRNLNSFPAENLVRLRCGPFFFFGKGRIKENFCMLALSQATKFMYCTKCGWKMYQSCICERNIYQISIHRYQGTRKRNVTEMLYLLRKPLSPMSVRKRTVHF